MDGRLGPHLPPDLTFERAIAAELSVSWVAGVDEAGRGALAGPVFAAAVMLSFSDDGPMNQLSDVRDSKLLSAAARERLYGLIKQEAIAYGIGSASAAQIDDSGIISATRQAIAEAVAALSLPPQAVLVDGPWPLLPMHLNLPQWPIVRGDQLSLSIAAASILAKVSRDRYMTALGERFPAYGFARHKGYGTAEHRLVLGRLGPCPEHRHSFAPLRTGLL
ncbi:MAG: ribonuclease HII [Candidatus Promineofilum sp.]|nr:ribonuclease HII [Promineifilum sp.]